MIFSRGLLRLLRSKLSYCVRHLFSPHEDIEIGRCVWKHVKNAIIPKAWETLDFFYQQYDKVMLVKSYESSTNYLILTILLKRLE